MPVGTVSRALNRTLNRFKFAVERFLLGGAGNQILAVALVIGLVALVGGTLLHMSDSSASSGESIWWAFLRLTDPGYLGDDEGAVRRLISTVVTILGYVLFMGSLVAILTQWLNRTIRNLERGQTPIVRNHHVLILGWTGRSAFIIKNILRSSGRLRRFLRQHRARRLHLAILTEDLSVELADDLRTRVGSDWHPSRVTLRSGSPLRSEHLSRVDFAHASAILLPAGEIADQGAEHADARTIKTLVTLSHHPDAQEAKLPLVVAEVLDGRRAEVAELAYRGPIEVIASDRVVARILAQSTLMPGLSKVYGELLSHREGAELFVRWAPELTGTAVGDLQSYYPSAVVLGIATEEEGDWAVHLEARSQRILAANDRVVLAARRYKHTDHSRTPIKKVKKETEETLPSAPLWREGKTRVLVLGWNHRVPTLVEELRSYQQVELELCSATVVDVEERRAAFRSHGQSLHGIELVEADFTIPNELEELAPEDYDSVILVGSDWLESGAESDARTIAGYLLLSRALERSGVSAQVLVEVLDPTNAELLSYGSAEIVVTPIVVSHMLAQVALRPELNSVFDALFMSRGSFVALRDAEEFDCVGVDMDFSTLKRTVSQRGEIALGWILAQTEAGATALVPSNDERIRFAKGDKIVTLAEESV